MKTLYNVFPKQLFQLIVLLVLLMNLGSLKAQNTCFNAIDSVGCPPFTVRIQECVADPTAQFRYDFGDGPTFDTSFTYQNPGVYSIEQIVQIGNDIFRTTKTNYIRVVAQSEPTFSLFACKNNNLKIQIDEDVYDHYVIEYDNGFENDTIDGLSTITTPFPATTNHSITVRGIYEQVDCQNTSTRSIQLIPDLEIPKINSITSENSGNSSFSAAVNFTATPDFSYYIASKSQSGSFQILDTIENQSGSYTYNINNLAVSNAPYQVKVVNFDYCGNIEESASFSTQLINLQNESEEISISWLEDESASFSEYALLRNGSEVYASGTSSEANYTDTDILCGTEYCYQLKTSAQNLDGSTVSINSNTACETGFSDQLPPAVGLFYSTVTETNQIRLNWEYSNPESVENYILSRTGSTEENTLNASENSFLFPEEVDPAIQNCYTIQVLNKCDNLSENNPQTCPTFVKITKTGSYTYLITWNVFEGFSAPAYSLILRDQNNTVILNEQNNTFQKEIDVRNYAAAEIHVQVQITDRDTDLVSYSNTALIDLKTYIYFPTGFTPNEDGLNDTFYPAGAFVDTYSLEIRNNWGQLVFQSENLPWDGFHNNEPAITGTYIYHAVITDEKGDQYERSGTITLVR